MPLAVLQNPLVKRVKLDGAAGFTPGDSLGEENSARIPQYIISREPADSGRCEMKT